MSQQALPLESHKYPARLTTLRWQGMSLKWKFASAFTAILLVLGLFIIAGVYRLLGRALQSQIEERTFVIATNLSDGAAGIMIEKKPLELHALVTKYARLDGAAYVFIETAKGEIAAHSLGTFPSELRDSTSSDQIRHPLHRRIPFRDKAVYEIRIPILEGQVGSVRVGMWEDAIQDEVRAALFPLIGLIAIAFVGGIALAMFFAGKIVEPILRLSAAADKLSKGDLQTPVFVESSNEIGDLACSLERMRTSLRAAISRLSRE